MLLARTESDRWVTMNDDECDHDNGICTDEAHGRHSGVCRGCGKWSHDLSNDDGWCGDCN